MSFTKVDQNNDFAAAAKSIIFGDGSDADENEGEAADAIDDTCDADEVFVQVHRNQAQLRVQKRNLKSDLLKKVVPFHWAPMLGPLTEADVDCCMTLEKAVASEPLDSSAREKMEYRIRKAGVVCYGLFNSCTPDTAKDWWIDTLPHARPVESKRSDDAKHVMFAHIIATLGHGPVISKDDMVCPENWRNPTVKQNPNQGHQFSGRTICLHSFAVCPRVQGVGIGQTTIKSYLQLMNESGMADRVAVLCRPYSREVCERFGFKDLGLSKEMLPKEVWHNMVLELSGPKKKKKEEPTKPSKKRSA